jgi:hypothetical protein
LREEWNAERALASPILRNHDPPHRIGPIRLRDQFLAQACQPRFQALLLILGKPIRSTARASSWRVATSSRSTSPSSAAADGKVAQLYDILTADALHIRDAA